MSSKEECQIYSFWNGKNLNGANQCFDYHSSGENCCPDECRCVEGTETVCADDL